MLEFFIFAVLALHGLACTAILIVVLWRAAQWRDATEVDKEDVSAVPNEGESTPLFPAFLEPHPSTEILPIMAEHFPAEYERFRRGELPYAARREVWDTCCAIRDARAEIEELCS